MIVTVYKHHKIKYYILFNILFSRDFQQYLASKFIPLFRMYAGHPTEPRMLLCVVVPFQLCRCRRELAGLLGRWAAAPAGAADPSADRK